MRTEAELNKLIAEFSGFVKREGHWWWPEWCEATAQPIPDGIMLIDFTHSLDALFKWAVPKLNSDGWYVELQQASMNAYWKARLWCPFSGTMEISLENIRAKPIQEAETLAPALARAIEKFIDGEERSTDGF